MHRAAGSRMVERPPAKADQTADRAARAVVILLPPILLTCLAYQLMRAQGHSMVDDSFITFRYVVNFARGDGLVWNPGEYVEGYTNLLWVLLLTPFSLLGLDLVRPAAWLGVAFAWASLEVLRRLTGRALPHAPPRIQVVPALLLACNPSFAFWAGGGMETPLFCFLVLLSAHLLLRAHGDGQPRLSWRLGVPLALCCLTRPEGAMIAGLFLGLEAAAVAPWTAWQFRRRVGRVAAPAMVVACLLLAHLAFRMAYYGDPLPNTFYAKVIAGWVSVARGVFHAVTFMAAGGVMLLPGLLAFNIRRGRARLLPYLVTGYSLLGVYLSYLMFIGGDIPAWYRFYVPLIPMPLLALGALVGSLDAATQRHAGVHAARGLTTLVCLAILSTNLYFWPRADPILVGSVKGAKEVAITLNEIFFRRHVPRDAYIAACAVGIVGYHARNRILDIWGLNDRYIAHQDVRPRPLGLFAHDKTEWLYVLNRLPDFMFLLGRHNPIKGYDICTVSRLPLGVTIYRRNFPLKESQRSLGMPPGLKRTLLLPPPCLQGTQKTARNAPGY